MIRLTSFCGSNERRKQKCEQNQALLKTKIQTGSEKIASNIATKLDSISKQYVNGLPANSARSVDIQACVSNVEKDIKNYFSENDWLGLKSQNDLWNDERIEKMRKHCVEAIDVQNQLAGVALQKIKRSLLEEHPESNKKMRFVIPNLHDIFEKFEDEGTHYNPERELSTYKDKLSSAHRIISEDILKEEEEASDISNAQGMIQKDVSDKFERARRQLDDILNLSEGAIEELISKIKRRPNKPDNTLKSLNITRSNTMKNIKDALRQQLADVPKKFYGLIFSLTEPKNI